MTDAEKLVEAVARRMRENWLTMKDPQVAPLSWDDLDQDGRDYWVEDARAALRSIDAAGWQLMPKKPTEDMWNAINSAWGAEECWANLLAAAPKVVP